jgi:hypothetical protein
MKKTLFILSLLLLLSGCKEEFPTYASFCSQERKNFDCLHYAVLDTKDKERLQNAFGMADTKTCPYRVELTKYHVGCCNNPVVKSIGGDFNGYVRVEVKKGFKCYYKIQSDYKDDADAAFERVLKKVKIDLNQ